MKSIRKMIIENFQSHRYSQLDFDSGLNVIVGASDQGKSAVIRALRWVLYNEPRGSDFIRVGTSSVRVTIQMSDGYSVTRERTPSKNRYIVVNPEGEEQVYEGFGNSVPQEVSAAHGVEKILLDEGEEKMLHLGMQLDGPFLLAESGAVKAKAIGRLNGVHIIDAAQRDTSRDLARMQQDEKNHLEQLKAMQEELEQFSDLPYMESILLLVEEKQERLQQMTARFNKLKQLREEYRQTDKALQQMEHLLSRTDSIEYAFHRLEKVKQTWERVGRLQFMKEKLSRINDQLAGCMQTEEATRQLVIAEKHLEMAKGCFDKQTRLRQLSIKWRDNQLSLAKVDQVLQKTKGVMEGEKRLEVLTRLVAKQQVLHGLREKAIKADREMGVVERYLFSLANTDQAEGKFATLTRLTDRLKQLQSLQKQKADLQERLAKAAQFLDEQAREMEKQVQAYQVLLKRSGTCPVCFSPIDEHTAERILAEFTGG